MAANRSPLAGKRLDSWKEIATFLGRAERTVKRWEAERGLPVHRVPGSTRGSVFAYSDELAEWLKGRNHELDADDSASGDTDERLKETSAGESEAPTSAVSSGSTRPVLARPIPLEQSGARVVPARSGLSAARIAAWLLPLAVAGVLVLLFSAGHRESRFKALASRHAPNPEAQELYLKGRYYWNRRTPDDLNRAVDYFTQAIVKDPSDAQAYVGLADCYNLLREFGAMPPSEAYPRALAAAQRAVELDDTSAEAHNSLAFVTFWWSWQAATAEREFKRALELNPNFVLGHHWYATYLLALHRHVEALDQIEQAQRLEPASTAILADKGLLLWCAGRQNEAVALLKQLETTEPALPSPHAYLAEAFWERKDYVNALMEWRRVAELRHDETGLALATARERGFATGGLKGLLESQLSVQKELVNQGSGSAYELAATYAALGQKQEALNYLQIAFDRREAGLLTEAPPIPSLHDDPDYQRLRAQVQERVAQ
jgi:Tfp pilus assembly protein PilF